MSDLKKRAERNGKVNRTVAKIEQTVKKLDGMKREYLKKAADAKARGESASYELCRSALNATLTQEKRAKEMLLNIRITAELQKMGETNADFLKGMSTIAKRISKINRQSDFVKLQKEIEKALSGMEEAQVGLDAFLQNTDAQFKSISSVGGALSDEEIDSLVDGRITEKQLLMDEQIERLASSVATPRREASDGNELRATVAYGDANRDDAPTVAKPFPEPRGEFDFCGKSTEPLAGGFFAAAEAERGNGDVSLADVYEKTSAPELTLGKAADGNVARLSFKSSPHVLVCGAIGSGKSNLLHALVCTTAAGFSADAVRFVFIDVKGEELPVYDGLPHSAAYCVKDVAAVRPTLVAVEEELDRRYRLLASVGACDIDGYNAAAREKLPYLIVVIDEYAYMSERDADGFESAYLRIARQSGAVGIYTALATRSITPSTVTPGMLAATEKIVFRTSCAEDSALVGAVGAERLGAGELMYRGGIYRAPFVSDGVKRAVVSALSEELI